MANDSLLFRKGSVSGIKTATYVPGAISITTDEPGIYIDLCEGDVGYVAGAGTGNRVRVGDFIPVADLAALNALAADENNVFSPQALYYVEKENYLLKYDETNKNFKWINDYSHVATDLEELEKGAVATNTADIATLVRDLAAETTERRAADKSLQDQITALSGGDGVSLASLQQAIKDEAAAREAADTGHSEAIGELESGLGNLDAKVGNLPDGTATGTTVVSYLSDLVAAEQTRAEGVESGLRTDVDAAAAQATTNQTNIADLRTDLNAEISNRATAINGVNATIGELDDKVKQNTTNITNEITRATTAEEALGKRIDAITTGAGSIGARVTALEGEVVQNASDISDNTQAIADEKTRAEAKEEELAGLISDNTQAIANEKARAEAKENELAGLISANTDNIAQNEAAIATNKGNIATNAENIETNAENIGKNADAIEAEKARAEAAENTLNQAIAAEKTRAEGIEAGLRSAINTEASNRGEAISALNQSLTKAYIAADDALREEINTKMAAADAMTFIGETDGFTSYGDAAEDPLPDSKNKRGDTYIVTKAFNNYQVGDLLVAGADQGEDDELTTDEARTNFWIWVKTGYSDFNDATLDINTTNNQIQLKSHLGENLGTVTLASQSDNIVISTEANDNGLDHTVNFSFVWGTF